MTWAAPLFVHDDAPRVVVDAARALRRAPFVPHVTARGPHRQTLLTAAPARSPLALTAHALPVDDRGTMVSVHVPEGHVHARTAPVVVIVHGLGGGLDSPYMTRLARKVLARGATPVLVELYPTGTRGRPPIFHAGNHALLNVVVDRVRERFATPSLSVVAVSLGGNIALRALADEGARARFDRAAVISPLVDLMGTYRALERPSARVYRTAFLRSLCARVRADEALFAPHVDLDSVYRARTVRAFDAAFAAPLGGYDDVWDYYRRAAALPTMAAISVPTLVLHAADDPLIPVEGALREEARRSPNVLIAVTTHGGHAGFVAQRAMHGTDRRWAENSALAFVLDDVVRAPVDAGTRARAPSSREASIS